MSLDEKVIKILSELFPESLPSSKFERKDIDSWDSLKHLDLIFAIEEEFQITVKPDDFPSLNSLKSIVNYIEGFSEA